jgi:hypothetical protein
MDLFECLVEISIFNTHPPIFILFWYKNGFMSQSRWYISSMKPASNNLAISLYYIFVVLGEMVDLLCDGVGLRVEM